MPTAENKSEEPLKLPPGKTLDDVIIEHEGGMPPWARATLEGIKKYQNVIYAVLTVILLAWAILQFRSKQKASREDESWWELEQTTSADALRTFADKYNDLTIAPYARLKLGRTLIEEEKYDEAIAELDAINTKYPNTVPGKLAGTLSKNAKENKEWAGKDGRLEMKLAELRKMKEEELKRDKPPVVGVHPEPIVDPKGLPEVQFETASGKFVIELDEDSVPNATANFMRFAGTGFWDKSFVYKVEAGTGVFLGDPLPDGTSPNSYSIKFESSPIGAKAGAVAFVRDLPAEGQPDTDALKNSACFRLVIFTADAPTYDGKFLVVGRVKEGLDTVRALQPPNQILSAWAVRRRDHIYTPEEIKKPEPPKPEPPKPETPK